MVNGKICRQNNQYHSVAKKNKEKKKFPEKDNLINVFVRK